VQNNVHSTVAEAMPWSFCEGVDYQDLAEVALDAMWLISGEQNRHFQRGSIFSHPKSEPVFTLLSLPGSICMQQWFESMQKALDASCVSIYQLVGH